MTDKLLKLQENIYRQNSSFYCPKLYFCKIGDLYEIIYHGEGYDDDPLTPLSDINYETNYGFCALLEFLAKNPKKIRSLKFQGWDEGANGTKNWDFTRLINTNVTFDNIEEFTVELTDPAYHNQIVIARGYDEEGQIAKLISRMPNLKILQVPSAPNCDFFNLPNLKIERLIVQAGYDAQNFIANLALANNLQNLYSLDYTNVLDDISSAGTTFEEYKLLLGSVLSIGLKYPLQITIRDCKLTDKQISELTSVEKIDLLYIDLKTTKVYKSGKESK